MDKRMNRDIELENNYFRFSHTTIDNKDDGFLEIDNLIGESIKGYKYDD